MLPIKFFINYYRRAVNCTYILYKKTTEIKVYKMQFFCKYCVLSFVVIIIAIGALKAQVYRPLSFALDDVDSTPNANDITDIVFQDNAVWLGNGRGLSVTRDNGKSFRNFSTFDGLGKGSVSAIGVNLDYIWVATATDTSVDEGILSVGTGISYSVDNGETWIHFPQPVDQPGDSLNGKKPTTTAVQNVTYDIAVERDAVWIASWGGGLRKSEDKGNTWQVVTPDRRPFDALGNLSHRAFSVISASNGLWVGTSGGIHRSRDGGKTWTTYTAQNGSGISGNFVVALGEQRFPTYSVIWAATWKAEGENEFYAVSKTTNDGLTWETTLAGEKAHNFAFNGEEVYVPTDNGLWKSVDGGNTWGRFPHIDTGLYGGILTEEYYAASVIDDILFVGTKDGLAMTSDLGNSWSVVQAAFSSGNNNQASSYAYPNPFSPSHHNVFEGEGFVRVHYYIPTDAEVSLSIYDFGMNKVKDVVHRKHRSGGNEYAELWDGRNQEGVHVANGVYFYRLELNPGGIMWGKIVVIN